MKTQDISKLGAREVAFDLSIPIADRVKYALAKRDEDGNVVEFPPTVSARTLLDSRLIHWITSYKALLKYVSTDYTNIFEPMVVGAQSGTRYQIPVANIVKFLELFEKNKL